MSIAMKELFLGATKSAISSATGLILGLPYVDPQHFSPATFGGWKHLAEAIGIVVLFGEARFWKQWADGVKSNGGQGT